MTHLRRSLGQRENAPGASWLDKPDAICVNARDARAVGQGGADFDDLVVDQGDRPVVRDENGSQATLLAVRACRLANSRCSGWLRNGNLVRKKRIPSQLRREPGSTWVGRRRHWSADDAHRRHRWVVRELQLIHSQGDGVRASILASKVDMSRRDRGWEEAEKCDDRPESTMRLDGDAERCGFPPNSLCM